MEIREVIIDGVKYVPEIPIAQHVSIHGMYDCHAFERFTGSTVDEVIENWLEHSYENESCKYGATDLCPAIVLDADGKELRRVPSGKGLMHSTLVVYPSYYLRGDYRHVRKLDMNQLEAYAEALKNDPDIPRLLATTNGER